MRLRTDEHIAAAGAADKAAEDVAVFALGRARVVLDVLLHRLERRGGHVALAVGGIAAIRAANQLAGQRVLDGRVGESAAVFGVDVVQGGADGAVLAEVVNQVFHDDFVALGDVLAAVAVTRLLHLIAEWQGLRTVQRLTRLHLVLVNHADALAHLIRLELRHRQLHVDERLPRRRGQVIFFFRRRPDDTARGQPLHALVIFRDGAEESVELNEDDAAEIPLFRVLNHGLQGGTLANQFPAGNALVLVELHDFHAVAVGVFVQLLLLRLDGDAVELLLLRGDADVRRHVLDVACFFCLIRHFFLPPSYGDGCRCAHS